MRNLCSSSCSCWRKFRSRQSSLKMECRVHQKVWKQYEHFWKYIEQRVKTYSLYYEETFLLFPCWQCSFRQFIFRQIPSRQKPINHAYFNDTLLYLAVNNGWVKIVARLIDYECQGSLTIDNTTNPLLALELAVYKENKEIVEYFLRNKTITVENFRIQRNLMEYNYNFEVIQVFYEYYSELLQICKLLNSLHLMNMSKSIYNMALVYFFLLSVFLIMMMMWIIGRI